MAYVDERFFPDSERVSRVHLLIWRIASISKNQRTRRVSQKLWVRFCAGTPALLHYIQVFYLTVLSEVIYS